MALTLTLAVLISPPAFSGVVISPFGTAWETTTVWGTAFDGDGDNVVWGTYALDGAMTQPLTDDELVLSTSTIRGMR